MGLNVLRCQVDILGTHCNKLLKLKIKWGGGGGSRFSFSTWNHVGVGVGAERRLLLVKKIKMLLGVHITDCP